MSITDELRDWFKDRMFMANGWQEIHDIADHIDAEHEQQCAESWMRGHDAWAAIDRSDEMAEHGWIRLPKDADDEYIHVRDKLDGYGKTITVVEMRYGRSGWVLISEYGNAYADCFAFTHHHKPTVEDVLREMRAELDEVTALYVGEAIDSDERDRDEARIFAEFAAKLRLAEGEDA